MNRNYDVAVVGAGTAGAIAALQAASSGARTLLLEASGQPGGTITNGGVAFPGLFHAWGRQVIAGIGWELALEAARLSHAPLPDWSRPYEHHAQHQLRFQPAVYALLLEEVFANLLNLTVRYHAPVTAVRMDAGGVTLCAGGEEYNAACAVDASGDAVATRLAGGRLRGGPERQPGTPIFRFSGYDFEALDCDALEEAARKAVAGGVLRRDDLGISGSIRHILAVRGDNTVHIPVSDPFDRSRAEIAGRRAVWRLFNFLRGKPGLERLEVDYLAPCCGIRESFVVDGVTVVSADDYVSGKIWPDAVCHAFYPVDLHVEGDEGLDCRPLAEGVVPSVPARALMVRDLPRLLAAGRIISSDRLANSALRVQAVCMATGQAAGALAALAALNHTTPERLDHRVLQDELRRHGAIIPGE